MKVVCIDNILIDGFNTRTVPLIINKVYDTMDICFGNPYENHYMICGEDGRFTTWHKSRFITLQEYRDKQLKLINIE